MHSVRQAGSQAGSPLLGSAQLGLGVGYRGDGVGRRRLAVTDGLDIAACGGLAAVGAGVAVVRGSLTASGSLSTAQGLLDFRLLQLHKCLQA